MTDPLDTMPEKIRRMYVALEALSYVETTDEVNLSTSKLWDICLSLRTQEERIQKLRAALEVIESGAIDGESNRLAHVAAQALAEDEEAS